MNEEINSKINIDDLYALTCKTMYIIANNVDAVEFASRLIFNDYLDAERYIRKNNLSNVVIIEIYVRMTFKTRF